MWSTILGPRALEHHQRDEYPPTRDQDTVTCCGTMCRGRASHPGLLLRPEPMHGGEVEPLQRPVEIAAVQGGRRRIVGEIIALETRTRALPPTARAGYAAAVRRAR